MSNQSSKLGSIIGTVVLAAVCAAGGWIGSAIYARMIQAKLAAIAMPVQTPTVAVSEVRERAYNLPERYIAHAEAMQEVDLLPQVDGYVKEIKFKEGDLVKEGQLLYVMDDEKYQAVVGQAKADLNAAETEARRAKRYFERMTKADERGITQLELDNAEATSEKAAAVVMQAKANLVVAEYNCKKARVYAPIAGQIGKSNAHIGDYVAPSKGALAHIVQVDPIRVSFPMTDRSYIAWRQAMRTGSQQENRLRILLPDGSEYAAQGTWDFDDNQMSKETASIIMRLKFANPDRLLVPGVYLTLLSDLKTPPKYPSVEQSAIVDLPGGSLGVFVLGEGDVVETRVVETLPMSEGFVPVVKGLKTGEKVVTSGTRKLHHGMKVIFAKATSNEENDPNYKPFKLDK